MPLTLCFPVGSPERATSPSRTASLGPSRPRGRTVRLLITQALTWAPAWLTPTSTASTTTPPPTLTPLASTKLAWRSRSAVPRRGCPPRSRIPSRTSATSARPSPMRWTSATGALLALESRASILRDPSLPRSTKARRTPSTSCRPRTTTLPSGSAGRAGLSARARLRPSTPRHPSTSRALLPRAW